MAISAAAQTAPQGRILLDDKPAESRDRKPDSVRFLYPEQVSVAAGKSSVVDLHFRVADGLHINSHTPRDKTLIPTSLSLPDGGGVKVATLDFPSGKEFAFEFDPKQKLSVYSDEFVVKVRLTADPGGHLLQGTLRYQACDTNSCYPPRTIPVAFDVEAK